MGTHTGTKRLPCCTPDVSAQKRSDAVSHSTDGNLLNEAALFQYVDAHFATCFREAS